MNTKHYVKTGDHWIATMAHSEVCMHMQIAGKRMVCLLLGRTVQLFKPGSAHPFSAPILAGEAGLYWEPNICPLCGENSKHDKHCANRGVKLQGGGQWYYYEEERK